MTHKRGNTLVISEEGDGECEMCGKSDELRPYGPNGENVCFDCAMKDEAAALRQFEKRLRGIDQVEAPVDALAQARKQ